MYAVVARLGQSVHAASQPLEYFPRGQNVHAEPSAYRPGPHGTQRQTSRFSEEVRDTLELDDLLSVHSSLA